MNHAPKWSARLMYRCLPTAPIESFYNNGVHQTNDPAIKEKLKFPSIPKSILNLIQQE
jgi:hypothetical protein